MTSGGRQNHRRYLLSIRPAFRGAGYDGSIATKRIPSARDKALAALKASDRKLARLIDATEPVDSRAWRRARPLGDPFSVLVYSIIGQQISGYAARAIAGRLQERFDGRMPSPAQVLATDPADLKSVGLSTRKVEYLRSLAEHIISGELQVDHLDRLPDDKVREQITATRGLGRWTADMFLLINLERPDILPIGDLGIRSAVQRLYRLDHLPSPREVDAIGEKWRPHRSLASLYLWASTRGAPTPAKGTPAVAAR
jgi:DNA-3-methyladenine glycosylase II